ATIHLKEPGLSLSVPVDRAAFETATGELASRIGRAIEEALRDAGVQAEAVDTVVLTGGGAQVPMVRRVATERFPHARIAQADRFGAVGLGLAVDAARRFS